MTNRRSRLLRGGWQSIRIAGTLDGLRYSDRIFTLVLTSGVQVRGVVASEVFDLTTWAALWGQTGVVSGLAKFDPSGSLLRVEAERVEPAEEHDLPLWGALPRPIFGPLTEGSLRHPQAPGTGVGAILGQLPDGKCDEEIIEALERLS
ncbi:MAG: hypothetical protein HYU42_03925 [Candidatus Rokubacteria bacterium]|nr:hypothetical protein [Candidatus Rokubacteria bacterium]